MVEIYPVSDNNRQMPRACRSLPADVTWCRRHVEAITGRGQTPSFPVCNQTSLLQSQNTLFFVDRYSAVE